MHYFFIFVEHINQQNQPTKDFSSASPLARSISTLEILKNFLSPSSSINGTTTTASEITFSFNAIWPSLTGPEENTSKVCQRTCECRIFSQISIDPIRGNICNL